jgi:hypothetical protein
MPHVAYNATGDRLETDDRLAVVALNACRNAEELPSGDALPMHGSRFQRVVRREIMSFRSDMIRSNPYWRALEEARTLVTVIRQRRQVADPDAPPKATFASRLQSDRLTSVISFH